MFFSPIEQFYFINLFILKFRFFDFSFSNVVLPLLIVIFLILFFSKVLFRFFNLIPSFWQFFFEIFFKFILGIIKQQIGSIGFIYLPIVFTLFIFIFFCNLLSLTPFGFTLTSHIIMIFFLSFTLFIFIFFVGIWNFNFKFFKVFIPSAPFFLLFLLIPIEIFSYFIRAFSLAIRLSANLMAGHTLVFIISGFIISSINLYFIFFFLGFFIFFVFILEFGIAFLQAYVFIVLFCIYLNDSLKSNSH